MSVEGSQGGFQSAGEQTPRDADDRELARSKAANTAAIGKSVSGKTVSAPRQLDDSVAKEAVPLLATRTLTDDLAMEHRELENGSAAEHSGMDHHRAEMVAMTVPATTVIVAEEDNIQNDGNAAAKSNGREPSTERRDPMKRLSREFARRAAAKASSRADARPFQLPTTEPYTPIVVMSDEHRKTCHVFVGDVMPDFKLPDRENTDRKLLDSLGERLTAVVIWNADNRFAMDQFEELGRDLIPLKELGVETIAIHTGPLPDNYQQLCEKYADGVLCLSDAEGSYFKTIAQSRLPRTYLLDADGKILWLDIEYSRTTRQDLRNAIHFSLKTADDAGEDHAASTSAISESQEER